MKNRALITTTALVFCAACKKQEAASPSESAASSAGMVSSNAPTEPAARDADMTPLLAQLTQSVRRYGLEQRAVPKNLGDLVAKGYLPTVPQAPPGKKFAINKNLEVYLADQ